jgi:cytochrome c5
MTVDNVAHVWNFRRTTSKVAARAVRRSQSAATVLEFSCHKLDEKRIPSGSVKALLPARGDILRLARVGGCLGACAVLFLTSCKKNEPIDEAKAAGLTTADFPQITADIFKPMDGGIDLSPEEIMGRNTWNLWSGGNQHFWNRAAQDSFGLMDLLKMLDNRKYPRGERFKILGAVNEPGFRAATKPDEYGLWLDEQIEAEPAGIDEKVHGKPSGVLGYRLFPNPDFNDEARKNWDGNRFMNDPTYYNDNKLVRPYRVGVACGACHIAPYPNNPPADPENPRWENLASAIGNQYINEGKVFACNVEKGGFFYEMLAAQPRGTSDTSRIATDHINNPNAINAIFLLAERERTATPEKMADGTLALPGEKEEMPVPHILKDGADSIGVAGATIRVYVNIGMFSEYWLTLHQRLIGLLKPQQPFEIPYAREHSIFWRATEERLANIAAFFRRLKPYHLADAPGGQAYITTDQAVMTRGREVFAESCAACHSSKQPPLNVDPRSGEGKAWFHAAVIAPDFLEDNFLSNDQRYPLTKIETNSARAFATNAKAGHVWDNFSSQTYKEISPVDELDFFNPFDETRPIKFKPKDKDVGPGYYRTPSLVSLWSSAPFLHNNALGKFTGDPSVAGRMEAFNDAVEKLLWPEKRLNKASIWRTQNECSLHLRKEFVPKPLRRFAGSDGYVRIGPIPKGTPVNLIGNLQPDFGQAGLGAKILKALLKIHAMNLSPKQATAELIKAVPELLAANKCPDFIEDKGHYFGTDLPDNDKHALIEYLKTL